MAAENLTWGTDGNWYLTGRWQLQVVGADTTPTYPRWNSSRILSLRSGDSQRPGEHQILEQCWRCWSHCKGTTETDCSFLYTVTSRLTNSHVLTASHAIHLFGLPQSGGSHITHLTSKMSYAEFPQSYLYGLRHFQRVLCHSGGSHQRWCCLHTISKVLVPSCVTFPVFRKEKGISWKDWCLCEDNKFLAATSLIIHKPSAHLQVDKDSNLIFQEPVHWHSTIVLHQTSFDWLVPGKQQ